MNRKTIILTGTLSAMLAFSACTPAQIGAGLAAARHTQTAAPPAKVEEVPATPVVRASADCTGLTYSITGAADGTVVRISAPWAPSAMTVGTADFVASGFIAFDPASWQATHAFDWTIDLSLDGEASRTTGFVDCTPAG